MTTGALPDLTGKTILQVIPDLAAGGAERTTVEVAEAIVGVGGRALVVSEGGRLEADLASVGGEMIAMKVASKNPFTVWGNAGKLARLIREQNVSLIHARSRAPAWSAYRAALRTDCAFVTTYHGAYSGTSGLKTLYNSVMAKGDLVIANSVWIAQHVAETHRVPTSRIVTIPRGVDLEAFDPSKVSHQRVQDIRKAWGIEAGEAASVFLLPGRLTEWKGQKLAIEALARLGADDRARILFILAGDAQGRTDYVDALKAAIASAGLEGRVRLVGHCDDMPAAFLASDVVLAPSMRPEAFGRVAAEASAMGRPVIVADHGGQRETVVDGQTGIAIVPGSASDLSRALTTLSGSDAGLRTSMGAAGRDYVTARFSKRGLQVATLDVYNRVLQISEGRKH